MPVSLVGFVLYSTYTTSGFWKLMSCALFSSFSPSLVVLSIYDGSVRVVFGLLVFFLALDAIVTHDVLVFSV